MMKEALPDLMSNVASLFVVIGLSESLPAVVESAVSVRGFCVIVMRDVSL